MTSRARLVWRLDTARGRPPFPCFGTSRPASGGRPPADIVRLLLLTGCRRGEIVELKRSEVEGDTPRLADSKTGPRTVWLSEAARTVLAGQPRVGSAYVFPSPRNPAKPRRPCSRFWRLARKEAGIEDVRLHDLRHTVASHAVARGVALSTVAKMLGHASPTMTLRYAHVGDRDTRAAAERIGRAIDAAMAEGSPAECASRAVFGGERAEIVAAPRGPSGRRDLFRKGG